MTNKAKASFWNIVVATTMVVGWHYDILILKLGIIAMIVFFGIYAVSIIGGMATARGPERLVHYMSIQLKKDRVFTAQGFRTRKTLIIDWLTYDLPFAVVLSFLGSPVWAAIYFTSMSLAHYITWVEINMLEHQA